MAYPCGHQNRSRNSSKRFDNNAAADFQNDAQPTANTRLAYKKIIASVIALAALARG
ncbi:MAG: hypothetical protein IAE89_16165 [Anaerolineae bacterium]|nr:hypothetical protein [Anaerolineae bacterium]